MSYEQITEDWRLYQAGIDYNNQLRFPPNTNYYDMLDENDRMIRSDQWRGVKANGLPTPVFNIEKPIMNYQVAAVAADKLAMRFTTEKLNITKDAYDEGAVELAEILTKYIAKFAEENKLDDKKYNLLMDAFKSGDMALYVNVDETRDTGQTRGIDENGEPVPVMGEIDIKMVDGCNVILGNYSDPEINANGRMKQPYVCLVFREMTDDVKQEAKDNGIETWDEIRGDEDYEYQVGDNSDYTNDAPESDKTTVVLRIYQEDGKVMASKSTKFSPVREPWDTKRKMCPVVFSGWEKTKNSYHYSSPLNGLHANQRYINKMFAVVMLIQLLHANPRLIVDSTKIAAISNKIGAMIEVNGDTDGAARYLEVAASKSDITAVIEQVISLTREMAGANDALQGNIDPEQASGRSIMASVRQGMVPIELPKQNLRQMWEDLANVLKDTMEAYYGKREITVEADEGGLITKEIDFDKLGDYNLKMKVDVGASSVYDEIARQQTLDNALQAGHIEFVEWLERIPEDSMPDIDGLIESRKPEEMEMTPEQLAQVLQTQPPEVQEQILAMSPEDRYMTLVELSKQ